MRVTVDVIVKQKCIEMQADTQNQCINKKAQKEKRKKYRECLLSLFHRLLDKHNENGWSDHMLTLQKIIKEY